MVEDYLFFLPLAEEIGGFLNGERFLVLQHDGVEARLDETNLHWIAFII